MRVTRRLLVACVMFACAAHSMAATHVADFTNTLGAIRKELHAAGYSPTFANRAAMTDWADQDIRDLNLSITRTHDWSLHAAGLPVCDTHFIFPLFAADASDPASYRFGPTDAMLNLARTNLHQKILFRLGTSIEHSEEGHRYNSVPPSDYAKYAEICVAIVKHYTQGWANGFHWGDDIVYWEIWNEPDLDSHKCWTGTMTQFNTFFATVLKRLKDEFGTTIKVGGPAMANYKTETFTNLLNACDAKGVVPDFLSWHYYGTDVLKMPSQAKALRAHLIGRGEAYANVAMMINEWRYVKDWDESTNRIGIDSAAYTAAVMAEFQNAAESNKLESAFHYGSGQMGSYGMQNGRGQRHQAYWGEYFAGQIFGPCTDWCSTTVSGATSVYMLAGSFLGTDNKRTYRLLVSDFDPGNTYKRTSISIAIKGVPAAASMSVKRLDGSQLDPQELEYGTGFEVDDTTMTLTLKKSSGSAVFLVTFTEL